MMTFKELKKLVKLPLYKEQRVPTVKALEESGVSVVAEKVLENHGSINVYQNGYVIYRAHKRVTVFSLRDCVHYKYDAAEGAGHHIEEAEFDDYEWHIRLVLEGEDRIFMNYEIIQGKWMPSREDREYGRSLRIPMKPLSTSRPLIWRRKSAAMYGVIQTAGAKRLPSQDCSIVPIAAARCMSTAPTMARGFLNIPVPIIPKFRVGHYAIHNTVSMRVLF